MAVANAEREAGSRDPCTWYNSLMATELGKVARATGPNAASQNRIDMMDLLSAVKNGSFSML